MFRKESDSDRTSYNSSNSDSMIHSIVFSHFSSLRLLQVFGNFREQEKLKSYDMGILGDVVINNIAMKVSCNNISRDKLDLILNALELVEPEFGTIKAELRSIIHTKTPLNNIDAERKREAISSPAASPLSPRNFLFSRQASPENDYQKACRLFAEGKTEQALGAIEKFKIEVMDSNPYGYSSDRGFSVTVGSNAYKLLANCYRSLGRYEEALESLQELSNKLHLVLTPASLQDIEKTSKEWKIEAEQYVSKQSSNVPSQLKRH